MESLQNKAVNCPYCGETIDVIIDCSILHQDYIEDCQVCCRPINFLVTVEGDDEIYVSVTHENE